MESRDKPIEEPTEEGGGGTGRFQLVSNKIEGATLELDLRLLAWSGYTMVSELRLVRAAD